MAKRKRLTPATGLSESVLPETETHTGAGFGPRPGARAPIADVAGQAAAQAALETLADEVARNRREGRVVQSLPLQSVVEDHMVRDRMSQDAGDQAVLEASLRARGQQTPIEVVEIAEGRYGLISGWRRLHALRRLHAETGEARFAVVQALIKPVETVSDGYVAMVEENEIRADLSYYERARLACEAIQRALVLHGRKILQTFQLYRPLELHGWLTLHQLYALPGVRSTKSYVVLSTFEERGVQAHTTRDWPEVALPED